MKYIQNLRGKNEQEVLNALGDAAFPLLIGGGDENEDVKVFIDDNQESLNTRINNATDIEEAFNITYKPYMINGYDQRISLRTALGFRATFYNTYTSGILTDAPKCYNYCKVSPLTFSSSNTDIATIDSNGVVTSLASGTTIIKVNFDGNDKYRPYEAQYTLTIDIPITVDPEPDYPIYNNHKYVDMGLPSGTKWSAYNMGATAVNEPGDYYYWGNTVPGVEQYGIIDENYLTDNENDVYYGSHTKYNAEDGLTTLEMTDDAARVNWGGNWRLPSNEEFRELCNSEYTTAIYVANYLNRGVDGILLTSKINNNTLFIPATEGVGTEYQETFIFTNQLSTVTDGPYRFMSMISDEYEPNFSDNSDDGFVTDYYANRNNQCKIRPVFS